MQRSLVILIVFVAFVAPLAAIELPAPASYLMDEAEERKLAATAGPPGVVEGATYYVLGNDGYRKVQDGKNGFHCFVERSWGTPTEDHQIVFDPRVRAPHCINRIGAESTMRQIFLVAELAMAGHDGDEIRTRVDRAYRSGELRLPEGLSLTYMMSKHQWLGPNVGPWKPHLMLWIPYLEKDAVGANPFGGGQPVVTGGAGTRQSVLVIPMADWVE